MSVIAFHIVFATYQIDVELGQSHLNPVKLVDVEDEIHEILHLLISALAR